MYRLLCIDYVCIDYVSSSIYFVFLYFYKKNMVIEMLKINKMIIENNDNVDFPLQEFSEQDPSQYTLFS